mmetsp:Transcript_76611/g.135165  ORF Transcript_76611/g.135165 Transcript_76611/m.135165 type:complete len:112 (+) Transcript_76611:103-438(+)|eukprot:CAMPEP_0197633716 /NCGR_PEP_ID=MMETSP1338-20131121/10026_1 /TAXON_ID=43686 ORGANISM="Pelagodinium beii, Strain RCC1491" /NCGR_SAMPLE_ID=MMETSP1338 /ASSEMBLY_ACC=CAM_ASM_000754 /LENGTH=111 /DNA_ID=CAMNT_0043205439 /DNA_START=54 /DNA_END=389 /DNA_ORIENTATION=+
MSHQRAGAIEGEPHIEFQEQQFSAGHIQRYYRFYMVREDTGKPYKTQWLTDLAAVKEERERCLDLIKKKEERREADAKRHARNNSPRLPPVGRHPLPTSLVISASRMLSPS